MRVVRRVRTTVVLPGRAAKPLRAHSPEPIVDGTLVWLGQQVRFTYLATPAEAVAVSIG